MRPGELGKLEAVVAFLKRADKEHKPCKRSQSRISSPTSADDDPCSGDVPMTYSMKLMKRWWVAKGSKTLSTSTICLK